MLAAGGKRGIIGLAGKVAGDRNRTRIGKVVIPDVHDGAALTERFSAGSPSAGPTVVTNSMDVASRLSATGLLHHHVVGGSYSPIGNCFLGPLAVEGLEQFTIDVAVLGASGITDDGISVADVAEAQVKRAAITRARRIIVLLDSSKVGLRDLIVVTDLSAIDTVITERHDPEFQRIWDSHGIQLKVSGA